MAEAATEGRQESASTASVETKREAPGEAPLFMSIEQLRARQSIPWNVKRIIPACATGVLLGESGTYKTFIGVDLGLCTAHGLEWCGRKTARGPVLFIAGEGGGGILRRIDAWHKHHGLDPSTASFRVCVMPQKLNQPVALARVKGEIKRVVAELGPVRLIIIDTLSQNFEGDENDNGAMATFFRNLVSLRAECTECTVLVVHHPGHSNPNRPRGSSVIPDNTDFWYRVEGGSLSATVSCGKQKDGDDSLILEFGLHKIDLGTDEDGEPLTSLIAEFKQMKTREQDYDHHGAPSKGKASKHRDHLIAAMRGLGDHCTESELFEAFSPSCGDILPDSKRHAFNTALKAAIAAKAIIVLEDGTLRRPRPFDPEHAP